jgi:hypothetical protein
MADRSRVEQTCAKIRQRSSPAARPAQGVETQAPAVNLYESLINVRAVPNGALMLFASISVTVPSSEEMAVSDLIYLASGVVVLLIFAGYAALLRRA